MRPAVFFQLRLRLRLQNRAVYLPPILSLNMEHKLGGGQVHVGSLVIECEYGNTADLDEASRKL